MLLLAPVLLIIMALIGVLAVSWLQPSFWPQDVFMAFWLVFLAAYGLGIAYLWLWIAFGKELVTVRQGNLILKKDIMGFGRRKVFPVSEVSNLRANGPFGSRVENLPTQIDYLGFRGGVIAFESRGKTHKFGIQLEEQEAREVFAKLAQRLTTARPEPR